LGTMRNLRSSSLCKIYHFILISSFLSSRSFSACLSCLLCPNMLQPSYKLGTWRCELLCVSHSLMQGFLIFSRHEATFNFVYRLVGHNSNWRQFIETSWKFIKNASDMLLCLRTGSYITQ
jgi:hypothetical protein